MPHAAAARPEHESWDLYERLHAPFSGPELLRLSPEGFTSVLADDEAVTVAVDGLTLPLAVPSRHADWVNQAFFDNRWPGRPRYVLDPAVLHHMVGQDSSNLRRVLDDLARRSAVLMVKTAADQDVAQALVAAVGTSHQSEAQDAALQTWSLLHYSGAPTYFAELSEDTGSTFPETFRAGVEQGRFEGSPADGAVVLLPEHHSPELSERLWQMFDTQMDLLVSDFPAFQRFTRPEFDALLCSPDGGHMLHFTGGAPTGLFMLLFDPSRSAPWLDPTQLPPSTEVEELAYCPALVVDLAHAGQRLTEGMFRLLAEVVLARGRSVRLYFECTDLSAQYVPRLIERGAVASGLGTIKIDELHRYNLHVLPLAPPDPAAT